MPSTKWEQPENKSDICPVLKDPKAFSAMIDLFEEHLKKSVPDVSLIVGIDARGSLFGPVLAHRLGIGFILVRRKGKLPGLIESVAYNLEYGKVTFIFFNYYFLRKSCLPFDFNFILPLGKCHCIAITLVNTI
nr:PREDICTED: adenine phosphoribosyltransferase-like [Latimeria chalumnae]|eukprot:XP_006014241.1 PREDICTED: adenine phosphoribosyltransferase-like [Latimeria chalumnae]